MIAPLWRLTRPQQKKDATTEEPVTSPATTETPGTAESPAADTTEARPHMKEKRRTSLFNSLGVKKDKKSSEATSETEGTEHETKKSPLPQKIGGLFRRPSKATKSEETQTETTPTATESAPIAKTAEGEVAHTKSEPTLTNGTSEAPKETPGGATDEATAPTPEVKASA
jgi:hypothetical protein